MQRLLVICRHAEPNDPYPLQPDFDRELTRHGQHQARVTGQWLRDTFQKMDAIVSSPAPRANRTAQLIADKIYFDAEAIQYAPECYNARESVLHNLLGKLPDSVNRVLLVGHNPGITSLARTLTGHHVGYLEPSAAIAIELDLTHWEDIHVQQGHIKQEFAAQE